MELKKSKRQNVKLRLGISGASGFGKSYSALLLAYGMTQDWNKIAIIDTENSSSSLYSHLGSYNVLDLESPYSPARYIEAIELCEKADIEVIIIDSITHEWNGTGGCLDIHSKLGGRFQDWANVTPLHQNFIDKILQSSCHVITTTRRKTDYSLDVVGNGRTQVIKHGTKEITREGFEYELTVNFELINDQHLIKASKDRTGLFMNKPEFIVTSKTGERLLKWCNAEPITIKEVLEKINSSLSISALTKLYNENPSFQKPLEPQFRSKKDQLEQLVKPQNFSSNGVSTS
ncbi:AAA family ATPase [Polaribacter sp. IC073]|uniref:AAA family ATPase n=1 Tax=Polaribacter sp. IC073 TaxID=2508540 RepID=UPI0011BDDD06|nr:AAA family ATPase [Polaribacter sp. IC073]TXD47776.1 AAA family ATPase [Polaribacter sp. IC073]